MQMENSLDAPLHVALSTIQNRLKHRSTYFGVRALKCPTDFWVYQEIIHAMRPDFIVEIGNAFGGSALALAHLCDLLGHGKVIGVDISHENIHPSVREHPRVTFIESDAVAAFPQVAALTEGKRVLVIEDSSHEYQNTLNILRTYSALTSVGDYFIVEDSICHHGLATGPNPGPYEAIEQFVAERTNFEVDRTQESFLITWNPKGFIKRVA